MASFNLFLSILLATAFLAGAVDPDKENEVRVILEQMESDVLSFRDEMERVYSSRCDTTTLNQCSRSNYNDCSSTFPGQECMAADEMVFTACGDGTSCNALWDKTSTVVRIPSSLAQGPQDNPQDADVIESICFSRLAERWMVDQYSKGGENQLYFGSSTGSFRIIPARHSTVCGNYDPRRRPWYVAASSGPKDVVLVIDISGSMGDYGRMELAKESAKTVVSTLTVADRVAIVVFNDSAAQIGEQTGLIRATSENKKLLIAAINRLEADRATNFYAAMETAFNALDATIRSESTSGCNIAVLFLTDGQSTVGRSEDDVIDLVNTRTAELATTYGRKTTIFTFSLGIQADERVMKRIACDTGGIWTPVDDFEDDLVTAMESYYKLYALGLGEGGNEDFVAWVEPYKFHTSGKMGTSVSTPVYDKSVTPPLFLGVATVDMYMDDLERILEEDASSSNMLNRFVLLSTARCPSINLSELELDALRFLGGGEEATCGASNSTNRAGIIPEECPFKSDLPNEVWGNTEMLGKDYHDRACCEVGTTVPSDTCPDSTAITDVDPVDPLTDTGNSSNIGAIVGGIVGAGVALALLGFVMWKKKANRTGGNRASESVTRLDSKIDGNITIMSPPSAPPINPAFGAN